MAAYVIYLRLNKSKQHIIKKALSDAKRIKMNAIAESKSEIEDLFKKAEFEINKKFLNIENDRNELETKKDLFYKEINKINIREEHLIDIENRTYKLQSELQKKINELNEKIQNITGLNIEEVKESLLQNAQIEIKKEVDNFYKKTIEETKLNSKREANKILLSVMEKIAVDTVTDNTTSKVLIDSPEIKGKIIGKEGRNIKVFEQFGGVDIIIDDAPNYVTVSSFNPIRREIAVRALKSLIDDGRIQPSRIEESLIIEENKLQEHIIEIGKEAIDSLGIFDFNEELVELIGRLNFRTSYGQNVLKHSIEVAKLCSSIAAEFGLDHYLALKCGLLHDIGKAVDYELEGSHVSIGVKILKKQGIDPIIINAVESHHDDVEKESVYAELVVIADTISAARPGARNNNFEDFFLRMDELEKTLLDIYGVKKAYALQAGRQIRVIVDPELLSDDDMIKLNHEVSEIIKKNKTIAGEISITIIRETRIGSKVY